MPKTHVHKRDRACRCWNRWPEQGPHPDCPQHGEPGLPRCAECGQFMPRPQAEQ